MMTRISIVLLFATGLPAQVPDAPKPHIDKTEWALLAADAGTRALDVYSTRQMLENGNHEMFLPGFVANHTPALIGVEGGAVALNWWVARRLEAHHRPRMAHIVTMIDISQDAPWAIHNLFLPKTRR